jgi:hypothetical protein
MHGILTRGEEMHGTLVEVLEIVRFTHSGEKQKINHGSSTIVLVYAYSVIILAT